MSHLQVTRRELVGFVESAIESAPKLTSTERRELRHVAKNAVLVNRGMVYGDGEPGCPAYQAGLWDLAPPAGVRHHTEGVGQFACAFDYVTRLRAPTEAGPTNVGGRPVFGRARRIAVVNE